jgi:hypothetical protein
VADRISTVVANPMERLWISIGHLMHVADRNGAMADRPCGVTRKSPKGQGISEGHFAAMAMRAARGSMRPVIHYKACDESCVVQGRR